MMLETDFKTDLELFEAYLRKLLKERYEEKIPHELSRAIVYTLTAPAKRIRPLLILKSASLFALSEEEILPLAAAVEFIHTYSLIHDDLPALDNDDLRRGQPTCHKAFGEAIAILTGDALFAEGYFLIAAELKAKDGLVRKVLKELSESTGACGMVGGQTVDILSEGKKVSKETLEFIHLNKTAQLFRFCLRAPAILAEASPAELEAVTKFGLNFGLAFQIIDDLLDETLPTEEIGKPAGSDRKKQKATYPLLYGVEESRLRAKELIDKAKEKIRYQFGENAEPLEKLADYILERSN